MSRLLKYLLLGEKKTAEQTKKLIPKYHNKNNHKLTLGQRSADKLTLAAGSWTFIIIFFLFILVWMAINVYMIFHTWDPYPFILLNLVLSCLAAIQAPIILMSQNRAAERDRRKAEEDFRINRQAEKEIKDMQQDLDDIKRLIRRK